MTPEEIAAGLWDIGHSWRAAYFVSVFAILSVIEPSALWACAGVLLYAIDAAWDESHDRTILKKEQGQ